MAKPNITYFLGAGASCNKLPTIANISDKIEYLRNHISTIPIDTHYHTLRNQLLHSLKITAEESKRFNTVDTYARKLYLNGTSNKLLELKAALSVCFIYWQLYDGRSKEHKPSPNIDGVFQAEGMVLHIPAHRTAYSGISPSSNGSAFPPRRRN